MGVGIVPTHLQTETGMWECVGESDRDSMWISRLIRRVCEVERACGWSGEKWMRVDW